MRPPLPPEVRRRAERGFAMGACRSFNPPSRTQVRPRNRPAERVVVVDPDSSTRSLIERMLYREGFDAVTFANAEDARRYLCWSASAPAVIVSERVLPGVDGLAFAEQVHADGRTAGIPIVLLTRALTEGLVDRALAAGVVDVLVRPLFVTDIVSQVALRADAHASDVTAEALSSDLSLAHALRALLSGVRSGRVLLGERGHLAFRQGHVIDASFDGLTGSRALLRALLQWEGSYEVSFRPPSLSRATLALSLEALTSEVWPAWVQWRQVTRYGAPLDARWVVDFAQLPQVLPAPGRRGASASAL